jgi:hypothetical protein
MARIREIRNAYRILRGKCLGRYPLEILRKGWENIKVDYMKTGSENQRWVDWVSILSSDRFWYK